MCDACWVACCSLHPVCLLLHSVLAPARQHSHCSLHVSWGYSCLTLHALALCSLLSGPGCRYDRSALSPLLAPVNSYSNVRRQPLPVLTGVLASLLQPGNPRATASSLARAYSGGQSEAAAQAVAGAAGQAGSTQASTVAQALTETAVNHPNVAPGWC